MVRVSVNSPNVTHTDDTITSRYAYQSTNVVKEADGSISVTPTVTPFVFTTQSRPAKLGVMLVGWGGNNGTTFTATMLANRDKLSWETKYGVHEADYLGSVTQCSTVRLGYTAAGEEICVPLKDVTPLVDPNTFAVGGWDISKFNIADSMARAQVIDIDLQRKLRPHTETLVPLPGIYYPDFIAANQSDRADNVLPGADKQAHLTTIRKNIQDFKKANGVEQVIILWTANTERFADIIPGVNDTAQNLLKAIEQSHDEVAPSTVYAVASILEGCTFINGSPQNTLVPGAIELAIQHSVFVAGDDFKSGQTKFKSVMVEFLVGAGIKPLSIASYNHLGNNDGKNLSAPAQFRSKEISKTNVVDDMVASNSILYPDGKTPDHCVVIKYIPAVGDSKRAMDEYTSQILMQGRNTIVTHNTCEDSLLATPLMFDLIVIAELMQRVRISSDDGHSWEPFHSVLSVLSYFLKAPVVPEGTPLINALFRQKCCIENLLRALAGLMPENHMLLEFKLKSKRLNGRHS